MPPIHNKRKVRVFFIGIFIQVRNIRGKPRVCFVPKTAANISKLTNIQQNYTKKKKSSLTNIPPSQRQTQLYNNHLRTQPIYQSHQTSKKEGKVRPNFAAFSEQRGMDAEKQTNNSQTMTEKH